MILIQKGKNYFSEVSLILQVLGESTVCTSRGQDTGTRGWTECVLIAYLPSECSSSFTPPEGVMESHPTPDLMARNKHPSVPLLGFPNLEPGQKEPCLWAVGAR